MFARNVRRPLQILMLCLATSHLPAQSRQAPPGTFKDLNDAIAGDALLIRNKQLFVDDYVIGERQGLRKVLNQPVKHPGNPLLVRDRAWEESGPGYGSVLYDSDEKLF